LVAAPRFEQVTFAVLDRTGEGATLQAFVDAFGGAA